MNIDFTRTIIENAFQQAVTEAKKLEPQPGYNTPQKQWHSQFSRK